MDRASPYAVGRISIHIVADRRRHRCEWRRFQKPVADAVFCVLWHADTATFQTNGSKRGTMPWFATPPPLIVPTMISVAWKGARRGHEISVSICVAPTIDGHSHVGVPDRALCVPARGTFLFGGCIDRGRAGAERR